MIGIFGGTFDPVHFGHLRPVLEVSEQLDVEHVRLIPCGQPPHREGPAASPAQRLAMLERAIAGVPGFVLDDRETRREGPSYMVDTLDALRADFPGRTLCLILGLDAFLGLEQWHDWKRLVELAHLVVMTRPGWYMTIGGELGRVADATRVGDAGRLAERDHGYTWFCDVTALEISSTRIRRDIAERRSVRFLVPEPVREYLEEFSIYQ